MVLTDCHHLQVRAAHIFLLLIDSMAETGSSCWADIAVFVSSSTKGFLSSVPSPSQ